MLQVQQYLLNHKTEPLQQLHKDYAIASKVHPDGRVILDYSMFESPKSAEITRECRGLVLDSKDWSLVAKPFRRFFNASEVPADDKKFNWDNEVLCTHKEDGSLILMYFYDGEWRFNTRFSWADSLVNESVYTWSNLVREGLGRDFDYNSLNTNCTYIFELCSLYNKVVRRYSGIQVYLLSVFSGETEMTWDTTSDIARELCVQLPHHFVCQDIFDAQAYIAKLAEGDPTFEGVVVRDVFNNRLKIKSSLYLQLHRLNNNGNVASVKNLLPLIMAGETDEVLTYFPELKDSIAKIEAELDVVKREIDNVWFAHGETDSQKKFAMAIQKDTRYTAPLFNAKKMGNHPFDHLTTEYLLKNVFNNLEKLNVDSPAESE